MTAKKKEITEVAVEQKLKSLYELQCTLSKIDEIKILRGGLPLEVKDLEDTIEGMGQHIKKNQDEIAALQKSLNDKKHRIEEAEASTIRYKEQLDNVKNNREYDTLIKEIEFQTLQIELWNKKIKEDDRNIVTLQEDAKRTSEELKELRLDLDVKKTELDEIIAETHEKEDELKEKAITIEADIDKRLLTAFKRIRKNSRNGLAVVPVLRNACGGCFNKIPPQRQMDIRMRKKLIVCEYCGRILVDSQLAGLEEIKPAEVEKPKRKRKITKAED